MNPYAIPPLIGALLNFFLILWVFQQSAPGLVRQTFTLWTLCLGLWNLGVAIGSQMPNADTASFWYALISCAVVRFIAPLFLHFVAAITGRENEPRTRQFLVFAYFSGLFFSLTGIWTTWWLEAQAYHFHWGYYPVAGRYEWVFGGVFFSVVGYALYLLSSSLRQLTGYRRTQIQYLLAGTAIYFGGAITNFLPLYKISIYPIGSLTNSFYCLVVAYAIVEYGLMDIRVVLRRSAVYGLLTGALTMVYLSMVMVFKKLFGHYDLETSYLYYTAAVPITVALVPPMKAHLEPLIESVPFWKTYRFTEILKDFGQSVLTILDLHVVSQRVIEKMCHPVHAVSGAIFLHRSVSGSFARVAIRGGEGPLVLEPSHPLIVRFKADKNEFHKEKTLWNYQLHQAADKATAMPPWLVEWPYALAFPLMVKHRLVGVVALGDKSSGDMYNADDVRLLKMMADQAAVALSNAQDIADLEIRQKVLRNYHDSALMGVLATQIAHEMTKPLTRIINEKTRIALKGASQQSLKKIEKEVELATKIMDGFAMLSPEFPLPRTPTALKDLLEDALKDSGIDEDSTVKIIRQYKLIPDVSVNANQMLQVFSNIIHNAWEAMPQGGSLTLTLGMDVTSSESIVDISFSDTGHGIPADLQSKVFEPFFTTKQTSGGRGVGLTLSRAMVERHNGEMILQSQESLNSGTRVTVRLPVA